MASKEVILLHELNSKMVKLVRDFNEVVNDLTELTKMVCQKELDNFDDEHEIKLHSHM